MLAGAGIEVEVLMVGGMKVSEEFAVGECFEAGGVKECWDRLRWDGRAGGNVGGGRDGKVLVVGGVDRSVGGGMWLVVLQDLAVR